MSSVHTAAVRQGRGRDAASAESFQHFLWEEEGGGHGVKSEATPFLQLCARWNHVAAFKTRNVPALPQIDKIAVSRAGAGHLSVLKPPDHSKGSLRTSQVGVWTTAHIWATAVNECSVRELPGMRSTADVNRAHYRLIQETAVCARVHAHPWKQPLRVHVCARPGASPSGQAGGRECT